MFGDDGSLGDTDPKGLSLKGNALNGPHAELLETTLTLIWEGLTLILEIF